MELQFQSDTCRCLRTVTWEVRDAELTQEVRLSDGMPDIGRVLASWGQVILRSKEWQGDLATVSGGVMVWILYAPEDGTPPRCIDTWLPFQLKWELPDTEKEGVVRAYPLMRFVDSRSISARKIMIRAGVAAMGEALSPQDTQIYRPFELPEDIQLLKNTYPIRLTKEVGEKIFLLDEDIQSPPGLALPERLLAYTMFPQIHEKRVAGDKVILRGSGRVWVVYRCAEGKIHTADLEIPLAQYAQLEDTYGNDAQADAMMGITSLELLHNEGPQLHIKCGMTAQYLVTDRFLAEVTEDAYSTCRSVQQHMEALELPAILEQRMETVQVSHQIPGIDGTVAGVSFQPDFPRQNRAGDSVTMDLCGQFQVLYYALDESLQGTSVRWETTMQMKADPGCQMSFWVQPNGKVHVSSGADGLSCSSQMNLNIQTNTETTIPMVTGIGVEQQREPNINRPSLVLCRSEGESLWSIAKRCGSTVDEIMRINRLDGQPVPEQMLLIPIV